MFHIRDAICITRRSLFWSQISGNAQYSECLASSMMFLFTECKQSKIYIQQCIYLHIYYERGYNEVVKSAAPSSTRQATTRPARPTHARSWWNRAGSGISPGGETDSHRMNERAVGPVRSRPNTWDWRGEHRDDEGRDNNHRPTNEQSYSNAQSLLRCFRCYETKYMSDSCRHQHKVTCFICGGCGHKEKHCFYVTGQDGSADDVVGGTGIIINDRSAQNENTDSKNSTPSRVKMSIIIESRGKLEGMVDIDVCIPMSAVSCLNCLISIGLLMRMVLTLYLSMRHTSMIR